MRMTKKDIGIVSRIAVGLVFTAAICFIIPGYQAILPVLYDEHVYSNRCTKEEIESASSTNASCNSQQLRLELMFTLAASITNIAGLLVSVLTIKIGNAWTARVGAIVISIGSILFGLSSPRFDGYIAG